jgi:hypothetical protein
MARHEHAEPIGAPAMSDVGSWEWAQRTGGRLGRHDRAHLIRQGIAVRISRLPVGLRDRLTRDAGPIALPAPPDTPLARVAEERVREFSTTALYGHCMRTWAFAALFAARNRVDHDAELLYAACVLHDLGLTPQHTEHDATAHCFAVEGARAAHGLLLANGEPEARARTVGEAISLHLNIDVATAYGPIAQLLSHGVMLDVVGRRLQRLPRPAVANVVARWPRDGSGQLLIDDTKRQATLRPHSRAALLHGLGFTDLVLNNPLDRL